MLSSALERPRAEQWMLCMVLAYPPFIYALRCRLDATERATYRLQAQSAFAVPAERAGLVRLYNPGTQVSQWPCQYTWQLRPVCGQQALMCLQIEVSSACSPELLHSCPLKSAPQVCIDIQTCTAHQQVPH